MKAPWDTNSIETSLVVINAVQDFKKTVMANWSLIENQPLKKKIPPIIIILQVNL